MIIPCMNSTSFAEDAGSFARVDGGSVFVGWPGAPGCTTIGLLGSGCCAKAGHDKHKSAPAGNKLIGKLDHFIE
jgi:hypothetical protein